MAQPSIRAVDHREGRFAGAGGLRLYYQAWLPTEAQPEAVLVNVHGLGDHSGLYPTLAGYFPARRISLYAFDMRGNGRSPGQRGHIARWQQYRYDLRAFLARVREWQPGCPLFVLGNSLGGLVVLEYALHYPGELDGVIAAAPPLGEIGVPRVLMTLGRIMSRICPRFFLNVGMDLSGLARDPGVLEAVLADPFFHRRGTARLSTEVTRTIALVQEEAGRLSTPLLILHGSDDRMVPPDGSRRFFTRTRLPDREFREYPGRYHGLFADFDHEEVLRDVEGWIRAHLPPPSFQALATSSPEW